VLGPGARHVAQELGVVVLAVVGCCFGRLLLRVGVAGRGLVVVVVGVRVVVVAAVGRADDWVVGVVVLLLLDERVLLAGGSVLFTLVSLCCCLWCDVYRLLRADQVCEGTEG
jgi:hypothetical protein